MVQGLAEQWADQMAQLPAIVGAGALATGLHSETGHWPTSMEELADYARRQNKDFDVSTFSELSFEPIGSGERAVMKFVIPGSEDQRPVSGKIEVPFLGSRSK